MLLEAELGGPWQDFYSELSPRPIAAASLGQVWLTSMCLLCTGALQESKAHLGKRMSAV